MPNTPIRAIRSRKPHRKNQPVSRSILMASQSTMRIRMRGRQEAQGSRPGARPRSWPHGRHGRVVRTTTPHRGGRRDSAAPKDSTSFRLSYGAMGARETWRGPLQLLQSLPQCPSGVRRRLVFVYAGTCVHAQDPLGPAWCIERSPKITVIGDDPCHREAVGALVNEDGSNSGTTHRLDVGGRRSKDPPCSDWVATHARGKELSVTDSPGGPILGPVTAPPSKWVTGRVTPYGVCWVTSWVTLNVRTGPFASF